MRKVFCCFNSRVEFIFDTALWAVGVQYDTGCYDSDARSFMVCFLCFGIEIKF